MHACMHHHHRRPRRMVDGDAREQCGTMLTIAINQTNAILSRVMTRVRVSVHRGGQHH